MNWYNDVGGRMEYIQKLFLDVGNRVSTFADISALIKDLDKEPPEYRSIAYEGASFEIGLRDLKEQGLNHWIRFKEACAIQHTFHIDIGLGWAFAKAGVFPASLLSSMQYAVRGMVFDGIGYYYALFKGRATLKAKTIPQEIDSKNAGDFYQGVGRRLWYMTRGNINEVKALVEGFPHHRHPHLFRGIGIACGYVGGNEEKDLKDLLQVSRLHYRQLQSGIILAAISRIASDSVNADIDLACRIVCNRPLAEIRNIVNNSAANFFYLYNTATDKGWFSLVQSELLQTH